MFLNPVMDLSALLNLVKFQHGTKLVLALAQEMQYKKRV